jgi:hypothetical protein
VRKTKLSFTRIACHSSERKRPYSRVLYSVLFETSVESESITLYSKFQIKINHIFGQICCYNVNKVVVEIMEMDDKELSICS